MNTTAGILAGLLVAGAAVSAYRFVRRKAANLRAAIDELKPHAAHEVDVIELERDPATGVFRRRA